MNQYELLYIVPAKLEEPERQQVVERVNQIISGAKGVIKDHNAWLTRKLSYPIGHTRQGIFMLAHVALLQDSVGKIMRELAIDQSIIRVSLLKISPNSASTKRRSSRERLLPQNARAVVAGTASAKAEDASQPADKVSLEELDKKLAELLSDQTEIK